MKIRRDLSTRENREYWKFVEGVAKEVDKMPNWMKGGKSQRPCMKIMDESKTSKQTQ